MLRKQILALFTSLLLVFPLFAQAASVNSLFHQANDPVAGNPKGGVTIVEFFDYQCSHCVDMAPVVQSIIRSNWNVRVVFKEFPIRGPMSDFAARAALAANKQGKYYDFNHALMLANQPLTEESIMTIAKDVGLNVEKLKKDMDSASIKNQIRANDKLAESLKITGTPAFFIGKTNAASMNDVKFILGGMSQSQMQELIDNIK